MKKLNFSEYEGKFDDKILAKMEQNPEEIDIETMRATMYGYTFTEGYAECEIPDELSMDFWSKRYFDSLLENDDEDIDEEDDDAKFLESLDTGDDYIVDSPQERLLLQTIESTGDGKTKDTALCVIDVHQEYEYIQRVFPYNLMTIKQQSLMDGHIDRIEFEPVGWCDTNALFFDISRRFDVGYRKR